MEAEGVGEYEGTTEGVGECEGTATEEPEADRHPVDVDVIIVKDCELLALGKERSDCDFIGHG